MKNRLIGIIVILLMICGYFGYMLVGNENNKESSDFYKKTQCIGMYSDVKQYLEDKYTFGESNNGESYGYVNKINLHYSDKIDSCIADIDRRIMNYKYTLEEDYYAPERINELIDVNNGYKTIYECVYEGDKNNDCRHDYLIKRGEYIN